MAALSELQAVKARLGGLITLDYTSYSLPSAHRLLGQHTRLQVEKILKNKLDTWKADRIDKLLTQSQACLAMLGEKAVDRHIDGRLRFALGEYLDCLSAWSDGAGLSSIDHPALQGYEALGPAELGMFLQNDCTGCQTGMYRERDGSVILWHTEEDVEEQPGSGFDMLRIAEFSVGDEKHPAVMQAFVYPDLLPGPAFGWRSDGYAQGVDKLHIRDFSHLAQGMLANVVTWLTLRLGSAMDGREVIESLQPYYDGYALNTVCIQDGSVRAVKSEFAGERVLESHLDDQAGSFLFQVNIFSDRAHPWVTELEDLHPDWCKLYEQRVERAAQAIQNKDGNSENELQFFFDMLTSDEGNDNWAYANKDVKAYFIHRQSLQGAETWLGDGPALPNDCFKVLITQLN